MGTPEPTADEHGLARSAPRTSPLIGMAALVVVVAGLHAVGEVAGPAFLGLVLIVTVAPIVPALHGLGVPRWLGTIVMVLAAYAILIAFVASLGYAIAALAATLPGYATRLGALMNGAAAALQTVGVGPLQTDTAFRQLDLGSVVGFLQGLLGQVTGALSALALVVTILLFLAIDSTTFPARLRVIGRTRPAVQDALTSFAGGTRRFVLVSTVFGLVIATLDVMVLWVLGVPLAIVFGLLALIANYIPSIGFLIAMVPPALVALLEGGPGLMLAVIGCFSVINIVLQTFVQPRFVGEAVGLSVTVAFLSVVFWGWVLGALGALLAIPLTLLAKALLVDGDPRTRWLAVLLAARPPAEGT